MTDGRQRSFMNTRMGASKLWHILFGKSRKAVGNIFISLRKVDCPISARQYWKCSKM